MCENKQMTAASGVLYEGVRFQIENSIVLSAFKGIAQRNASVIWYQ